MSNNFMKATESLAKGKIIAYPTESVWGLGVDATNQQAVNQLNQLKKRPGNKSFIILVDTLALVSTWIDWTKLPQDIDSMHGWPGPITKCFPINSTCPDWLGHRGTIAIRISAHPITMALCQAYAKPIISTSANQSGCTPMTTKEAIQSFFGHEIDHYVAGQPGGLAPTKIIDLQSGKTLR